MDPKDQVKESIDIVDYIGQSVKLKQSGRNFKGLCPFHTEKSPSFMVSAERQSYKCFGCGEGGDIFSFYMKREGVTFPEALKDLAHEAGVELTDYHPPQEFEHKNQLIEINQQAAKLYNYILTKHKIGKPALKYLADRGVNLTQIKDFQLGYAPQAWRTITNFLTKKKFSLEEISQTGLILQGKSDSYYDRFRGRVMFPLQDARGNIAGFSGRVLPEFDDGKMGKYINTPETILYHKSQMLYPLYLVRDSIRRANNIIIVEGEFDVLSSIKMGSRNTVAVKGSALTTEQVKLIKRFCDTIILALDADDAGVKAAQRAIQIAQKQDIQVKVIHLPSGKDPDELIQKDPKLWKHLIKTAMSVYEFFLLISAQKHDAQTIDGKRAITDEIVPILNQIQNQVIQDHYIHKLAELLQTDNEVIKKEMNRRLKKNTLKRPITKGVNKEQKKDIPRIQLLLEDILVIIFDQYPKIDLQQIPLPEFPDRAETKIIKLLIKRNPSSLSIFAKTLPPELQPTFDHNFLKDSENITLEKSKKSFHSIISEVAKLTLRDKLSKLRNQLSSADDPRQITQDINHLIAKLRQYS